FYREETRMTAEILGTLTDAKLAPALASATADEAALAAKTAGKLDRLTIHVEPFGGHPALVTRIVTTPAIGPSAQVMTEIWETPCDGLLYELRLTWSTANNSRMVPVFDALRTSAEFGPAE